MTPAINREGLQVLYGYNARATNQLLDTLTQLSYDEYNEVRRPNYTSIRKLATHSFAVERFFLAQCQEQPLAAINPTTPDELREAWQTLNEAIQNYLDTASDDELNRSRMVTMQGRVFEFPAWQLLTQALVHSTHHRGELALMLGAIEHPLPTIDIIVHFFEQTGQKWPWK